MRHRKVGLVIAVVAVLAVIAWVALRESSDVAVAKEPTRAVASASPSVRTRGNATTGHGDDLPATASSRSHDEHPTGENEAGVIDGGIDELTVRLAKEQLERWLNDNADTAARRVDEYCEKTKAIPPEQRPSRQRERDAAQYLLGRVDWENGRTGTLQLPAATLSRLGNNSLDWQRLGPELYTGLDFSWMRELMQFDHWSVAASGPVRDLAGTQTAYETPLPNYLTLRHWVKLRLLKGLHEGNFESASAEVRHLAELCGTTNTLIGDMIRLSILGIERGFLGEHHAPLAAAMTEQEQYRMRDASFAGMYFLLPGVSEAVRAKALGCAPNRCSALSEAIALTTAMRGSVSSVQGDMDWLMKQQPCDQQLATLTSQSKEMTPQELNTGFDERSLEDSMNRLVDADVR